MEMCKSIHFTVLYFFSLKIEMLLKIEIIFLNDIKYKILHSTQNNRKDERKKKSFFDEFFFLVVYKGYYYYFNFLRVFPASLS